MSRIVPAILGLLLLGGCASFPAAFTPLAAQPPRPAVYIGPVEGDSYQHAELGVLLFQMPANMSRDQAVSVAALFKEVFLAKQAFRTVRLLDRSFADSDEATRLGRGHGVDLVLAGRVNYAVDATELGGARVDVTARLINVATGNTVWYMEQVLDRAADYPDLGFVSRLLSSFSPPEIRGPVGPPAVPDMLARIASNMAEVVAAGRDLPP